MHYMSGTVGEGLFYKRKAQTQVWGHYDSRHASDKVTSKERSGYVFLSVGAVVGVVL